MPNSYDTQPWTIILIIVAGLALLGGLVWCNWRLSHVRQALKLFRGELRFMAMDKHHQVKMANTVLKQVMTLSTVSLLPQVIRIPVNIGKQLVGIKRQ
jgi:hypothetical protein